MNALTLLLADRSALKLPIPDRWAACRKTPLQKACFRSIAREANRGPNADPHLADWAKVGAETTDADEEDMCVEELDEIFARQAAEEAWDDRAYRYEQRTGECWETSDELRREWDEIRPVRATSLMPGASQ